MTPKTAKSELKKRIKASGTSISSLTLAQGVRLILDFYRETRAEGCELEDDGDMVLFQWGTCDFGEGNSFKCGLVRQFTAGESDDDDDDDDDGVMSQLSLSFHFTPSASFKALKNGNRWCSTPDELEDFEAFIVGSKAHKAVATTRPVKVTLEYADV